MTGTADPTARFSDRAQLYARWRPGYPAEAFDFVVRAAGLAPGARVADLGAGTGISSQPWLARGFEVAAVEPNEPMRRVAEAGLGADPRFRAVDGTAEATGLDDAGVELAFAAQAFHWFDRARARAEIARVLRPGGNLALLWNDREKDATPFDRGYEDLLLAHGTDYRDVDHTRIGDDEIAAFYAPGVPVRAAFPHRHEVDREGLVGRVVSCSYVPGPGEPGHQALVAAVERLFDEHARGGRVALSYRTRVWLGPLPRRG